MGKIKTLEVIIRGDIVEKNIVLKLGKMLGETDLRADFSASVAIPPFIKAVEKRYPSVCVMHVTLDREDRFSFEKLLKECICAEGCEIVSICELQ